MHASSLLATDEPSRPEGYVDRHSNEQRQSVESIEQRLARSKVALESLSELDRAEHGTHENPYATDNERTCECTPVREPRFAGVPGPNVRDSLMYEKEEAQVYHQEKYEGHKLKDETGQKYLRWNSNQVSSFKKPMRMDERWILDLWYRHCRSLSP